MWHISVLGDPHISFILLREIRLVALKGTGDLSVVPPKSKAAIKSFACSASVGSPVVTMHIPWYKLYCIAS